MAITLKENVHTRCLSKIQEKINNLNHEMGQLNLSYGVETKSSSGDKYETHREMINQEKEKINSRLAEVNKMRLALEQIDPKKDSQIVGVGSLIRTEKGWFFISVPLGAIENMRHSVFAISQVSPVGKALMGKRAGDHFEVSGVKQKILEIH